MFTLSYLHNWLNELNKYLHCRIVFCSKYLPDGIENVVLVDLDQLGECMEELDSVGHSLDSLARFDSISFDHW